MGEFPLDLETHLCSRQTAIFRRYHILIDTKVHKTSRHHVRILPRALLPNGMLSKVRIRVLSLCLLPKICLSPLCILLLVECNPFLSLFTHSPWFFSPSCGAACCRNEWDPHCHHWLHPCAPKAEKRFAQNMSSYLKSLADSYQHQADMIKPPRPKSAPPI